MKITGCTQVLTIAPKKIDKDPNISGYASMIKMKATQLAENITLDAINFIEDKNIMEHPLLIKWYRDAFGYEYMEGTSHIQAKHVFQCYANRKC